MTETEAETDPTQETQTNEETETDHSTEPYSLEQIGGHKLTAIKPVFTNDSKYLLVASGARLRRYAVDTGNFITSHYFGHESDIVSVQPMAGNDEMMVSFTDGTVIFADLSEDRKLGDHCLNIKRSIDTLVWCQLVSNYFYYTTIRQHDFSEGQMKTKCHLHFCPKNLVQQTYQVDNSQQVNRTTNSVAFCPTKDPKYCVSIHQNVLNIYEIPIRPKSLRKRHLINEDKQFTCVVCHPFEEMIITGDSFGRIIVWHNFAQSNDPSRSIWHWHQWPVADLCLSAEGTALYSGGAEMTLVKWNLSGQQFGQNNFMPRMGEPIRYVASDPNLNMIATTHKDNIIQLLGPQMKGIHRVIEGLSASVSGLSTDLHWNPKMKSIACNGRTGHLQFYSPKSQKQLFQLDVVSQNIISSTKETDVIPTEVTRAAVSRDGVWLCTYEMRDDLETSPEMRLKFWELNKAFKDYMINTIIHLPHNSSINYLEFSPDCRSLVSTSNDREFKVWNRLEDHQKMWWKCFKVGNLNGVSVPSMAKWSADSSLLAVAFDHFITLWNYFDKTSLKFMEKLSVEEKDSKLIFIGFGNEEKSHYLIEGRNYSVKIWNLLDLSVLWSHEKFETITCIAFDKWENKLAVITERNVDLFDIGSEKSRRTIALTAKQTPVIAALFSDETNNETEANPLLSYSKLYCMNDKQELFAVTRNTVKTELIPKWSDTPLTPIAQMLIDAKLKRKQQLGEGLQSYFETNRSISKLVDEMFFTVPSHVLPPIDILSKTFLQSLNNCREESTKVAEELDNNFKKPNDFKSEPMVSDDDMESDIQSIASHNDIKEREREVNAMIAEDSQELVQDIDEDYSWLNIK